MGRRVSLFVTCMVDQLFPQVGMAMADVLERVGCHVDFPENQTCCGQPAFNSGYRAEARTVARHFLDTFESSESIVEFTLLKLQARSSTGLLQRATSYDTSGRPPKTLNN